MSRTKSAHWDALMNQELNELPSFEGVEIEYRDTDFGIVGIGQKHQHAQPAARKNAADPVHPQATPF